MRVQLEFKPQDMWIGVYWHRAPSRVHVWICLIPCFPIHISWTRQR